MVLIIRTPPHKVKSSSNPEHSDDNNDEMKSSDGASSQDSQAYPLKLSSESADDSIELIYLSEFVDGVPNDSCQETFIFPVSRKSFDPEPDMPDTSVLTRLLGDRQEESRSSEVNDLSDEEVDTPSGGEEESGEASVLEEASDLEEGWDDLEVEDSGAEPNDDKEDDFEEVESEQSADEIETIKDKDSKSRRKTYVVSKKSPVPPKLPKMKEPVKKSKTSATKMKIVDVIAEDKNRAGTTWQTIKKKLPDVSVNVLKRNLVEGIIEGVIIRSKKTEESTGVTGRFKVPKPPSNSSAAKSNKSPVTPSMREKVESALEQLVATRGCQWEDVLKYLLHDVPSPLDAAATNLARRTFLSGLQNGWIVRTKASAKSSGLQGYFKLASKKPKTKASPARKKNPTKPKEAKTMSKESLKSPKAGSKKGSKTTPKRKGKIAKTQENKSSSETDSSESESDSPRKPVTNKRGPTKTQNKPTTVKKGSKSSSNNTKRNASVTPKKAGRPKKTVTYKKTVPKSPVRKTGKVTPKKGKSQKASDDEKASKLSKKSSKEASTAGKKTKTSGSEGATKKSPKRAAKKLK